MLKKYDQNINLHNTYGHTVHFIHTYIYIYTVYIYLTFTAQVHCRGNRLCSARTKRDIADEKQVKLAQEKGTSVSWANSGNEKTEHMAVYHSGPVYRL